MTAEAPELDKPKPGHVTEHLANERTYLAWIRTSISIIGLGFVVARFGVWLRQLSSHVDGSAVPAPVNHPGMSLPMGVSMMAVGGLLAVIASRRYRQVRHAIDRNEPVASGQTIMLVTILTLAITASLIIYMLIAR